MVTDSGSSPVGKMMPPPPDYEAVTTREFERARAEGTRQALIRFIARHPDHPLADRARRLLSDPSVGRREAPPDRADPDADIYAAFDRALQRNTVKGYEAFIGLHPAHPLAEEARRLRDRLAATGRRGTPRD